MMAASPPALDARPPADRARILFVMYQSRYTRLFEAMIGLLAQRGHRVHLAFEAADGHETTRRATDLVGSLCVAHPNVTAGPARCRDDRWLDLGLSLGRSIDFLRYLSAAYERSPKLRARAQREAPRLVVALSRLPLVRSPRGLALLDRALRRLERAIPDSPAIDEFIRSQAPDIVLVTPLVAGAAQADYVRSAKSLGVRTALCVASWDNLTNKGVVRDAPDHIYVWNEDQVREAVDLHGIPAERVVATGAHSFDQWFAWRPSTTPEEFRQRLGLPAEGPLLLYLCSSKFVATYEPPFVERWVRELRSSPDERLRNAGVLVRPHPKSGVHWAESELAQAPGVAVWPPTGASTTSERSKSDFFDSIFHSSLVVGLNTSALIESTILRRRAFTLLAPEFQASQEGTLHFRYLLRENGGPLTVAHSFEEHIEQLGAALEPVDGLESDQGFLRRFVRPHGLDRDATPVLADSLAEQVRSPAPSPKAVSIDGRMLAAALAPLASLTTWVWARGPTAAQVALLTHDRAKSARRRAPSPPARARLVRASGQGVARRVGLARKRVRRRARRLRRRLAVGGVSALGSRDARRPGGSGEVRSRVSAGSTHDAGLSAEPRSETPAPPAG